MIVFWLLEFRENWSMLSLIFRKWTLNSFVKIYIINVLKVEIFNLFKEYFLYWKFLKSALKTLISKTQFFFYLSNWFNGQQEIWTYLINGNRFDHWLLCMERI